MRRSYLRLSLMLAAIGGSLLLGACQPHPAATPTPTRTPGAVVAPLTWTPNPTATSIAVTAVPSNELIGPESYAAGMNPMTGLAVADPAVLNRRPLAIKVSNNVSVNPQSGMSFADWVFEHYAEGRETRYTAVFYSQTPELVGSVRSGRLIDIEIVQMADAILSTSGFSGGTLTRIQASNWASRNLSGPTLGDPYLVRIPMSDRDLEHTLFAVPAKLWELATERGINQPPDLTPGLVFNQMPNAGGSPASRIGIDYGLSYTEVGWEYDAVTGLYKRLLYGKPHLDDLTDRQIAVANVVMVFAQHVFADYIEDGFSGELSTQIQIWAQGPAVLFRDGQRFDGSWSRWDAENMLAFTDANDNVLTFKPGQTWFEIVPIDFNQWSAEP